MLPGYLHFDVRRGLCADMLNASMAALLSDRQCVQQAFDKLQLQEISFVLGKTSKAGATGHTVHFYAGDELIRKTPSTKKREALLKTLPIWDGRETSCDDEMVRKAKPFCYKSEFLRDCLAGEVYSLKRISDFISSKSLKPSIAALAIDILTKLECESLSPQELSGSDTLWLVCHLIMLCAQVDALDPKFISASKIYVGILDREQENGRLSIKNDLWMKTLLTMMPLVETEEAIEIDALGIAFLKSLAGQFGVRGNSTILHLGIGFSAHGINDNSRVEALWCEANLPESIAECGPTNGARIGHLHQVSGIVPASTDAVELCCALTLYGAKAIYWHLVHGEKGHNFYHVKFICEDHDKRQVIEAFLVKGFAKEIFVHLAEHHELNRRLVAVPLGQGNKVYPARFYEYIYFDKIIRVEPLKEDLDAYVEKTSYSTDVARSDLLLAWKKWRGQMAEEADD